MGEKAAAFAGWIVGVVIALSIAFVAAYSLLVPECVTDGDLRGARLYLALNAVFSVVTLVAAVYVAVRVRRAQDADLRFLAGPGFASTLVGVYVVVLLVNRLMTTVLEVPGPTASCF